MSTVRQHNKHSATLNGVENKMTHHEYTMLCDVGINELDPPIVIKINEKNYRRV